MINKIYLETGAIQRIQEQFLSNKKIPNIHLHYILDNSIYDKIRNKLLRLDLKKDIEILTHSYKVASLSQNIRGLINNKELLKFISFIINKKVRKINALCYSFKWKDYTLLHDKEKEKAGFDFILDFTEDWNEYAGGQILYTESKGEGLVVPAVGNSLLLVNRKNKHARKFVKYVNHHAGKNRRFLMIGKIKV
jgi:hypothetical protein